MVKLKQLLQQPIPRFLLTALGLYIVWFVGYEQLIHPWGGLDELMVDNLSWVSNSLLDWFGFPMHPEYGLDEGYRTVIIDGSTGIWIGDPCNGLELFALFSGFVIAFPGPLKKKLWYIPVGLISIHLINLLRILGLALLILKAPGSFEFNHNYTFTLIVYGWVFFLWILWARKYSGVQLSAADTANQETNNS